ncbi:2'-5' RNA ligase [Jannaschia seosinensis]|uniref:RNA 2',3'-cyclic phosphodiesterase n=1 Tax=Jannaschia seosinensis TaxID=313367 RepID=A0A0M7B910_9RHOB|nr:RNA 2',3'-cyclic phosphodiesterase [Jannaschia seosinensis]CUH33728.1 2'-5' RNA ligase [Jannaschia seosinensis]
MRAFVGIPVPETWITPLVRAQKALPGGRDVDPDDLHVTLAFLDDQSEDRLEAMHEALETRALAAAPLRPAGIATLGDTPRAVVLDLAPDRALTALRDAVRGAARAAGIDLPRDRFRPHVTLTRFGGRAKPDMGRLPRALEGIGAPDLAAEVARLVVLWSSTLTPDGPVYEVLANYQLRGAADA